MAVASAPETRGEGDLIEARGRVRGGARRPSGGQIARAWSLSCANRRVPGQGGAGSVAVETHLADEVTNGNFCVFVKDPALVAVVPCVETKHHAHFGKKKP